MTDNIRNLPKGLIDDVRKLLEAKKTNKHGHDPVGQEDADINNDRKVDKIDSYLHNRRKAIKASMKEDTVDESSEAYGQSMDTIKKNNISSPDKDKIARLAAMMSKEKKPVKEDSIDPGLEAELKAQRQTKKSVEDAKKKYGTKPVKEESEQIDELSKDKMLKYLAANKKDDTKAREQGDMDRMTKRMRGTDMAVRKYTAKPGSKYVKVPATEEVQIDELSKGTLGSYVNKAAERIGTQGVTAGLKIAADEKSSKNFKNIAKRQKGIATAVGKLTKEEAEQIDELSTKKLSDYAAAASDASKHRGLSTKKVDKRYQGVKTALDIIGDRHASGIREESDVPFEGSHVVKGDHKDKYGNTIKNVAKHLARKAMKKAAEKTNEEVELDEARGRPPKEGSAAWKARQAAAQSGEEKAEPRMHIMQQLQRAKLSMHGGSDVKFENGETHNIKGTHAAKLLDKYAGMKPAEKEDFQKKIGKSHEHLKSEL